MPHPAWQLQKCNSLPREWQVSQPDIMCKAYATASYLHTTAKRQTIVGIPVVPAISDADTQRRPFRLSVRMQTWKGVTNPSEYKAGHHYTRQMGYCIRSSFTASRIHDALSKKPIHILIFSIHHGCVAPDYSSTTCSETLMPTMLDKGTEPQPREVPITFSELLLAPVP